jgi:hypothetical protein
MLATIIVYLQLTITLVDWVAVIILLIAASKVPNGTSLTIAM